ncbi:hypothetical protein ABZ897_28380 [Nonomuraea sp. NPDC046802]|uniref:hypothetical protein n=1 Tax=Nonomuraea sp. NPDC046802 TaxID=3154919 RepID=UPI0033C30497
MTTHLDPPEPIGGGLSAADSRPHDGAGPVTHPGTLPGSAFPPTRRHRAVGYIRLRPTDPPGHGDRLAASLSMIAARSGLDLIDIYTEPPHPYRRTAFLALIQTLRSPHVHAVVIPAPWHLSEFDGIYRGMRMLIEGETRSEVVIADEWTAP